MSNLFLGQIVDWFKLQKCLNDLLKIHLLVIKGQIHKKKYTELKSMMYVD